MLALTGVEITDVGVGGAGALSCGGADAGGSTMDAGASEVTDFATSGTTFGGSTHADCIGGGAGIGSVCFNSKFGIVIEWFFNQSS